MYLGHRGQEVGPELEAQIGNCMDKIMKACSPGLVWRRLPVKDGCIEGFPMEGKDIFELLSPCSEAVVMAATLGADVEHLLMKYEITNMADALIMDACASTAIENLCDNFESDLRNSLKDESLYLTDRFSPGYGDLPLAMQRNLCELLDASRRIGLTVSDMNLMIPRKSVTAIMGISDKEVTLRKRGCEACSMFMTCTIRKNGKECSK